MTVASNTGMSPVETTENLPRFPLPCSEVMRSPVLTLDQHATVLDAARTMRDCGIGLVAVCGPTGRLVGVVTDRDIATRLVAEDRGGDTVVAVIMTPEPTTCLASEGVGKAERLMRDHLITRVVVTDPNQVPIGVISLADLAQDEPAAQVGRTLQTVSARSSQALLPKRP